METKTKEHFTSSYLKRLMEDYSTIQRDRLNYQPELSSSLVSECGFSGAEAAKGFDSAVNPNLLQRTFPNIFDQPLVEVFPRSQHHVKDDQQCPLLRIGVVFCGRQSPGGHNVVYGIWEYVRRHCAQGSKLFGFINGTKGLFNCDAVEITEETIMAFKNQGGYDMLGRSVDRIKTDEELNATLQSCTKLQLNGLVLVGGPTTLTHAAYLAEFLAAKQKDSPIKTRVIGIPGTIDGDIKSRYLETVFGFDTVCKVYSNMIGNIAIDGCSATKYYYFIRLMGRQPSHITLECALQTNPNIVIIGEEVGEETKPLTQIVSEVADIIVARSNLKKDFGVVLISEGLVNFIPEIHLLEKQLNEILNEVKKRGPLSEEELNKFIISRLSPWNAALFQFLPQEFRKQLLLERESGGTLQHSQIEMEKLLAMLVEHELKKRKKEGTYSGSFSYITHFFGYQARSSLPSIFDCNLAFNLGFAAGVFIGNFGLTGVCPSIKNLISQDVTKWKVWAVPLILLMNKVQEQPGTAPHKQVPIIASSEVDLRGKPFQLLKERRETWSTKEMYRNPGPIQFEGPSSREILCTLMEEQRDVVKKVSTVEKYCDALKLACSSGRSDDVLDAAVIGLESLTKIVNIMK